MDNSNSELQTKLINKTLGELALKEGILDADAVRMISHEGLSLDDNLELQGGSEAIAKLRESKPYLFPSADSKSSMYSHIDPLSKDATDAKNDWLRKHNYPAPNQSSSTAPEKIIGRNEAERKAIRDQKQIAKGAVRDWAASQTSQPDFSMKEFHQKYWGNKVR